MASPGSSPGRGVAIPRRRRCAVARYARYLLHDASGQRVATLATTHRETLLDCLLRHDRPIRTQCRGSLICGGCVVRVDEGLESLPAPNSSEVELLERVAPTEPHARLACQIRLPPGVERLVVSTDYW